MKTKLNIIMIVLVAAAILTACNNMNTNPSKQVVSNFLTISPADNSQGIDLNTTIIIQFAAPVDKNVIEKNFVLISQKDISDSLCPESKNMGHSDMDDAMKDSNMMNHLQKVHCTKGTFQWNADSTECHFKADTNFEPNTDYMMYIDSDMMNHMRSVMSSNGMMNGSMGMMNCNCGNKGLTNKTIITHFKTRDK